MKLTFEVDTPEEAIVYIEAKLLKDAVINMIHSEIQKTYDSKEEWRPGNNIPEALRKKAQLMLYFKHLKSISIPTEVPF